MLNETTTYIGLGSNLDQPILQLKYALASLEALPHTRLVSVSRFYHTAPVGLIEQPDFVNAVACLKTSFSPHDLLAALHAIEKTQGRVRVQKNGPRTLDLDVLLYGEEVITEPHLTIPHPRLHTRAFVLVPLLEIAPDLVLPDGRSVKEYLVEANAIFSSLPPSLVL
jgi:2-amino-4-hydroxy-6-hydroxymethyldihydropteridine diphosphokinase